MTLQWPDQNMVIPSQNQSMSVSSRNTISSSKYFFNLKSLYFILVLPCCKCLPAYMPWTGQGMRESSQKMSQSFNFKVPSELQFLTFLENKIFMYKHAEVTITSSARNNHIIIKSFAQIKPLPLQDFPEAIALCHQTSISHFIFLLFPNCNMVCLGYLLPLSFVVLR